MARRLRETARTAGSGSSRRGDRPTTSCFGPAARSPQELTFRIRARSPSATRRNLWLRSVEEAGLEHSTVLHYQQHVREHIRPFIGGLKLTAVTTPRVYAFVDELREGGRSAEMRRRAVQSLGRVLKFAKGRGLVGTNPVADVTLASSRRGKPRPEIPTRDELRAIVAAAEGRWRPLILTALFTGLRASELRGLSWSDVDLSRRILTVSQRADAGAGSARRRAHRAAETSRSRPSSSPLCANGGSPALAAVSISSFRAELARSSNVRHRRWRLGPDAGCSRSHRVQRRP